MVLVKKWLFLKLFFFIIWSSKMENVFFYILERKDAFLGYKKIEVQKVKKLRFFQGGYPMVLV